jgi:hypothetical protein
MPAPPNLPEVYAVLQAVRKQLKAVAYSHMALRGF